jgi:hypothetical protein
MSIYIVNGAAGAGKTTFEQNIEKITGDRFCYILSTITPVKEIAKSVGWDGTKDLKSRKFLSDLKDLLTEWNDYPFKYICEEVERIEDSWLEYGVNPKSIVFFIDCREPKEIKKLCDKLGAKSLLIRRASAENSETSNHADKEVLNYNYDIVIENNGNLREFTMTALEFAEKEKIYIQPNIIVDIFGNIQKVEM